MHPDTPQSTTAAIVVYATKKQASQTRRDKQRKNKWTGQNLPRTAAPPTAEHPASRDDTQCSRRQRDPDVPRL